MLEIGRVWELFCVVLPFDGCVYIIQVLDKHPNSAQPYPKQLGLAPVSDSCYLCSNSATPLSHSDWRALWDPHTLQSPWCAGHSCGFSGPRGQRGPVVSSLKNQLLMVCNWWWHLEEEETCNSWDVIRSQQVFLTLPATHSTSTGWKVHVSFIMNLDRTHFSFTVLFYKGNYLEKNSDFWGSTMMVTMKCFWKAECFRTSGTVTVCSTLTSNRFCGRHSSRGWSNGN